MLVFGRFPSDLLTHPVAIVGILKDLTRQKPIPGAPLLYLTFIFLPLQGFFNIVVYIQPHVRKERRKGLSWWATFKVVVASGGDDAQERTNRRL